MTNSEFDNYLTLLSSLLQIRGEQREAIAKELKAHLEDRLDELLDHGVEREEAVRIALAEFGDAAGLAANFSLLGRNRRRRWVMKVTSFSMAALVLLAVGIIAIWPEHRPGPAPQPAVAQQPGGQPSGPGPGPIDPNRGPGAGGGRVVAAVKSDGLDDKLSKRITAEFVETPVKDVLSYIGDVSDVQIFINRKALEDDGVPLDAPVTINLKSVRVDMLLDLVLEQVGANAMTYVERDGILIVSTMANLEGASEVRVYNCRDLLSMETPGGAHGVAPGFGPAIPGLPGAGPAGGSPGPGGSGLGPVTAGGGGFGGVGMGGAMPGEGGFGGGGMAGEMRPLTEAERRARALQQLIQTAIKPASWSEQGGFGTISEYNGLLVVNHNSKTHKEIENVLRMLREAAGLDSVKAGKVQR
jgi:uncharacterized protein YggL (DUF469 family)